MPQEITLPMILEAHADARMQDTHTAVPGQIVSWSASTQTATVQPTVRKPLPSADGVQTYENPPEIQNVPCYVLRGGGYLVSVPFAQGDPVWLMFSEQSYAEYLENGVLSSPRDLRRHGIGYPFALPGPAPTSLVLQSPSPNALVIGRDGQDELITVSPGSIQVGASGTVALAKNQAIVDLQAAITGWIPQANDGGAALKTALTTWLTATYGTIMFKTK